MLNSFSIDVEDWYQSSYNNQAPISELCYRNTQKVLGILDQYGVKGTFYVQGMVAKEYPELIREIDIKGHEIQSHGYTHKPVNRMTPKEFFIELIQTSKTIEDIIGKPVTGFRAPDFSIDLDSWWAFEVMIEAGIKSDSSIFPIKTNRYGVKNFLPGYSVIKTKSGTIEEMTVSIIELNGLKIPVGGGGYVRLLHEQLLKFALRRLNTLRMPYVLYCHPYEFNRNEWQQMSKYVSGARKLHQGVGRKKFQKKIISLFNSGKFTTMDNVFKIMRNREK